LCPPRCSSGVGPVRPRCASGALVGSYFPRGCAGGAFGAGPVDHGFASFVCGHGRQAGGAAVGVRPHAALLVPTPGRENQRQPGNSQKCRTHPPQSGLRRPAPALRSRSRAAAASRVRVADGVPLASSSSSRRAAGVAIRSSASTARTARSRSGVRPSTRKRMSSSVLSGNLRPIQPLQGSRGQLSVPSVCDFEPLIQPLPGLNRKLDMGLSQVSPARLYVTFSLRRIPLRRKKRVGLQRLH
jgi:hypothetical protein